jgi:hypothetical protein
MDDWLFALQLGAIMSVVALIALWTVKFGLRASRADVEPVIKATAKELSKGWYQVQIAVANRAPYAVIFDELRRVRPRAARLMAPIKQISTREGEFQVWSHPSTDKATMSIPLELALGPHDAHTGTVSRAAEGQVTAWLFLPEGNDPEDVALELVMLDHGDHLRRYRFDLIRDISARNKSGHDEGSR